MIAGCQAPSIPVPLEAWNRTTVPILLVDPDGRRLEVPACGHAGPFEMRLLKVEIRTEAGYVNAVGTDGFDPQYLVVVAAEGGSELSDIRPNQMPPCDGIPRVQPAG